MFGPKPHDSSSIDLGCVQNQLPSTERYECKIPIETRILPLLPQLCWNHIDLHSTLCLLLVFQVRLWRWEGGGHTWWNGIFLLCNHTPPCPALHPHCACPCQHFLPMFSHHTQTGDTTGKKDTRCWNGCFHGHNLHSDNMGEGGGGLMGKGGLKGRDKNIYI